PKNPRRSRCPQCRTAAAWTGWTTSNGSAPTKEADTLSGVGLLFWVVSGSARQPDDETGSGGGNAGDRRDIDAVRPAVLRQMEQRIAADQGHIAPASMVDVARLAARYHCLRRDPVRRPAGAGQFRGGQ